MSRNDLKFVDGKVFVGCEPRSKWARTFNVLVVLTGLLSGLAGLLMLSGILGDIPFRPPIAERPEDDARLKLARADELATAGKLAESARLDQAVALGLGAPETVDAAVQRVKTLLARSAAEDNAAEQAGVIKVAVSLERAGQWPEPRAAIYGQGKSLVEQRGSTDPAGALEIFEAVAPIAPKGEDLNAVRRSLLEKLVATQPNDPEVVSRLAAVFEAQGQNERAVAILGPIRARLGTTEGARILGLADARRGRVESALALLRPYTRARLESFRVAESDWKSAMQTSSRRVVDQLIANPPRFDSGWSEKEKSDRIIKFMDNLRNADPEFEQVQQRWRSERALVPVALELGTMLLTHAQSLPDRKARESELDEAEKLFMDVAGLTGAGDADRLRLSQAEVHYWRNKPHDGRALIDQVLESRKRDPELLTEVSRLLRRVGSAGEARALCEEAYRYAQSDPSRWNAAVQRGLMGLDLDDKILWLRRGNPTDPEVKVLLCSDLGEQAMERGDIDEAVARSREAVALYDAMREEAATLNNSALILFRLAKLTGDRAEFDRGRARLEKAHTLQPSDSVTMVNLAEFGWQRALFDIIGPAIDLRILKASASLQHLTYLYQDQASRKFYGQRLRKHAGLDRPIALLERSLLLAPHRGDLYRELNELYCSRGEMDKQRGLMQRLERIELDQADEIAWAKFIQNGGQKDQSRAAATGAILRAESVLRESRSGERDLTFAVAAAELANARMSGFYAGVEADADAIVALAEEAHDAGPSYQTRSILMFALLFRASRRLADAHPSFARMAIINRRSTTDSDLIGVAINGANPLGEAARKDPDVGRVVDLIREMYRDDPGYEAVPWTWNLLRAIDPQAAGKLAHTYLTNESAQISRTIQKRVEPASASAALSFYWAAEMVGENADGLAILKAYAARGVLLPIELP